MRASSCLHTVVVASVGCAALSACGTSEGDTYTLYRSGVLSPELRVHVATFDAKNDGKANRENCDVARDLFAKQPGVTVRGWCEKGRFRN